MNSYIFAGIVAAILLINFGWTFLKRKSITFSIYAADQRKFVTEEQPGLEIQKDKTIIKWTEMNPKHLYLLKFVRRMSNMEWLTLSLIATALWAASNTIDKVVLSEYIKRPIFCIAIAGFLGFIFAMIGILSFQVQIVSTLPLILSLIEGFVYISALLLYFKALSTEEVTRIVPVLQTIPIITLFLSMIFLGEILKPIQYIGIGFIVIGVLGVSFKKRGSRILMFNKAFWLILLSCLLFGISWVLSKYILNSISYWNLFFWSRMGGFLAVLCLLFTIPSYRKIAFHLKEIPKKSFGLLTISEVVNLIALFIASIALSKGLASTVSTVTSSQPLFVLIYAFLLSRHFQDQDIFKAERSSLGIKLITSALIIIGFFLVRGT